MGTITEARALPIFVMEGTEFYIDTRLNEFREKDAPWNRISMDETTEEDNKMGLVYDTLTKNVHEEIINPDNIPPHVRLIIIPSLTELDPVGVARKVGLADDTFTKAKEKISTPKQDAAEKKIKKIQKRPELLKNNK